LEFGGIGGIIGGEDGAEAAQGCAMKPNVWEMVRKKDGTFDMFHKGKLLHRSIPDKWLEARVGGYGFCGPEYHDIRRPLD
jgi:hypothetical protein